VLRDRVKLFFLPAQTCIRKTAPSFYTPIRSYWHTVLGLSFANRGAVLNPSVLALADDLGPAAFVGRLIPPNPVTVALTIGSENQR
jgi:hypothetical protein